MALQQYRETPGSWRLFAKRANLNDFKDHKFIRPHFAGNSLPELPPGGELKNTAASEAVYRLKGNTYGELLSLDRRDIINDDVGVLIQYSEAIARKAASTVSDLVWTLILANGNNHFSSGNSNLTDAPLSIDGLSAAITKMRKQTDSSGKPIDIQPRTLVVPPELEGLARNIIRSTEIRTNIDQSAVLGVGTGNPIPDNIQLGVEARISATGFHANASETAWYLFGSESDAGCVVGFLSGHEAPVVEVLEAPANRLGMTMRGYIDCAAALGDYRAAVASSGDGT
jgi:hypothetical protein